jgi:hypothetical protein
LSEFTSWQGQQALQAQQAQLQMQPPAQAATANQAATAAPAQAQANAGPRRDGCLPNAAASGFAEIDLNRDGIVSRDEISVQPTLSERFAEFDLNGDGVLSQTEFAQLRTQASQRAGVTIERRR